MTGIRFQKIRSFEFRGSSHWLAACLVFLTFAGTDCRAQLGGRVTIPGSGSSTDWERQAERVALNHFAFQDRRSQVLLERAREQLADGQSRLALETLQSLLGDPQQLLAGDRATRLPWDSLYWNNGRLDSVRGAAIAMIESLPPEQLDQYEAAFGATAKQSLDEALRVGDVGLLQQVARCCFATQAGFEATDRLAVRMLDRGNVNSAADLGRELIESPAHRRRVSRGLVTRTIAALLLADRRDEAQSVADQVAAGIPRAAVPLTDVEQQIASLDPAKFRDVTRARRLRDWTLPFGDSQHNGSSQGTTPYLEPVWSQPLYRELPYSILDDWEQKESRQELTEIGAAVWPIVMRGQLVVRDLDGVRGVEPHSGRTLWQFNATLSTPRLISEIRQSGYGTTTDEALIELTWIGNAMLGAVTSDGERVFAIDWLKFNADDPELRDRRAVRPGNDPVPPVPEPFQRGLIPGTAAPGNGWHVANRVVCLEPPDADDSGTVPDLRPGWSVGGDAEIDPGASLSGHLFLGAPVVSESGVFVMTESLAEKELNLVKLNADDGSVLWIQKLGLVEQAMYSSTQRFREQAMCLPSVSHGVVVCPTDAGYVVGVDELTGSLEWLSYYGAPITAGRLRLPIGSENHGYKGMPDPPHVHNGRIVYLPRQSDSLHCLDLKSGERIWKTPRIDDDDRYVAAVTDSVIAIVGQTQIRGIALDDGRALWSRRLDLPSGRGCQAGENYYVPLKNGSVAGIELATGRLTSLVSVPALLDRRFNQTRDSDSAVAISVRAADLNQFGMSDNQVPFANRPGNLLFHNGLVISTGPQFMTAFAQSDVLLKELHQTSSSAAATAAKTPAAELRAARIELSAGRTAAAEARLTRLLATSDQQFAELARWQLRQVILDRLSNPDTSLSATDRQQQFERLAELSQSPAERHRVLIEAARLAVAQSKPGQPINVDVLAGLLKAADLGIRTFIPGEQATGDFVISVNSWTQNLASEAFRNATGRDAVALREFAEKQLAIAAQAAASDRPEPESIAALTRAVDLFAEAGITGRYRNLLADRLIQSGRLQEAELHLLRNEQHPLPQTRAVARALLIGLWHQAGLSREAGRALRNLQLDLPDADLSPIRDDSLNSLIEISSSDWNAPTDVPGLIAAFNRDSTTWTVSRDLLPARDLSPVRAVLVSGTVFAPSNPEVDAVWDGRPRRVAASDSTQFNILRNETLARGEWQLMDREDGAERGRLRLDGRNILSVSDRSKFLGHFMPVGGAALMRGVSLLELQNQRPIWHLRFPPAEATLDALESIEPGPVSPACCVFQTRKHLLGVSPATGEVLWRRSDLDLASGVFVDREAGLFGDDKVIVMFHRDQKNYTLFSTQTGETIRRDRLDIDFRYSKRVFGRKLFFRTQLDTPGDDAKYRVWDPLTNSIEFEEDQVTRMYHEVTSRDELAIVNATGRLRILKMPEATVLVDLDLGHDAVRTMTGLNLFSDDDAFFVNLHSSVGVTGQVRWQRYHAGDVMLPVEHVHRGQLLAIDRRAQNKILWQAETDQRTYLRMDAVRLPFLIGISQMGARSGVNQRTLEVELLDRRTGEIVGGASGLLLDRLVFCKSLRDQGLIELHGTRTRIDLDFSGRVQGILLEQNPL